MEVVAGLLLGLATFGLADIPVFIATSVVALLVVTPAVWALQVRAGDSHPMAFAKALVFGIVAGLPGCFGTVVSVPLAALMVWKWSAERKNEAAKT